MIKPVYHSDNKVYIIDQTLLPGKLQEIEITTVEEMREAICTLMVRGAPAIGIACAYGVYLAVRNAALSDTVAFRLAVNSACDRLCSARPTAANPFWAADRMRAFASRYYFTNIKNAAKALLDEAQAISDESSRDCLSIGCYGAELLKGCHGVLTHCNAGALAATEYGTATAPLYLMHRRGHRFSVYVDETRPMMQGARLTAYELSKAGLDVTVITDSMAGVVLREGWVSAVIVGADRIARNGDTANKIGTYSLSVLAKAHSVPFYVAAPFSTVDFKLIDGSAIPIEHRPPGEVRFCGSVQNTPDGARIFNPSFDVTPSENITAIITEYGVAHTSADLRRLNDFGHIRKE